MRLLVIWPAGMSADAVARLEALASKGVELALVCARRWPEGGAMRDSSGLRASFPVHSLPTLLTGRGAYYAYIPGTGGVVRRFRPDLIHLREEVYTVAGAQFLAGRAAGFRHVPFVFESWQNIRKRYPWPARAVESAGYRGAAGAVAGAPQVVRVLQEGGFRKPVKMIPLGGIDPGVFTPEGPLLRSLSDSDVPQVGFLGRLTEAKGVDLLVEAVRRSRTPVRLVIAGDGPARASLEGMSRGCDVRFLGPVGQENVPALLRSLTVVVLPSRTTPRWKEQWGRVLTEAMACGTPVIGSSSGEIPFVVEDAGLIFEEGSVESLQEALERVLSSEAERDRLTRAGIARASGFTWEAHATRMLAFYRELGF